VGKYDAHCPVCGLWLASISSCFVSIVAPWAHCLLVICLGSIVGVLYRGGRWEHTLNYMLPIPYCVVVMAF
jgi:hypothetical protein